MTVPTGINIDVIAFMIPIRSTIFTKGIFWSLICVFVVPTFLSL